MKKKYLLLLIYPLLLTSCAKKETLSIFISCENEVDKKAVESLIAQQNSNVKVDVIFATPTENNYTYQYMACREKRFDYFVLRDEEFVNSNLKDIFVPFNDEICSYISRNDLVFYSKEEINYGIKLTNSNAKINEYVKYQQDHQYYIAIAKDSKHCGSYSYVKNITSTLAFEMIQYLL